MPVSVRALQQMAIYLGIMTGGGCAVMYYLMQKNFARSEYYRLAMEQLNSHHIALERLGAPPIKAHNIRFTDRSNRIDKSVAQIKIPVSGAKSAGYLYTSSVRDAVLSRWCLQEVVLQLKDGQRIHIFNTNDETQQHQD
ncbi:cytochrome c oxidase assembly factor 1 homolog [Protopterus annectens]|uniref:cytochrome c oxidase assembly factor 1 homolog n=1 Tax=Protopterus annectens TaxID=7888 RepID=UPI001CFA9A95|nr:cytochrome c oxidase assembly factor 1 homolog [Protopterus annectens]XP_043937384.1 cytochrome c oxidase assembly factor 1 homolog [Protopterus annectens]